MSLRRLGFSLAFLLLAVSALAQLTREEKEEVLDGMNQVLTEQAFVPGVDLDQWETHLERRRAALDRAETPREFAYVVNSALSEFGVSHIRLSPSRSRRMRRVRYGEPQALQDWRGARAPAESLRWLDGETAVLTVRSFGFDHDPERVGELFEEARKADRLIIDLRSNPGGEVGRMEHFLSHVIPGRAPIGTFVSRRMAREFVRAGNGDGRDSVAIASWSPRKFRVDEAREGAFKGRIAVIVNEDSASASEIIASALRELRQSPIVGRRTSGAVLMSTFERLPHGFRIQFPISDYVSIRGHRLEGHPIQPDVELSLEETRSEAAIEAALERLRAR